MLKKSPAWRLYTSCEKDKISAAAGLHKNIGECNRVAIELFDAEPASVRLQYETEAVKVHADNLAHYEAALDGAPSDDPTEQQQ